jgi:hypothetical protein
VRSSDADPPKYWARLGSSGDDPPMTIRCRTIFVQANLTRQAPLARSPNTHLSCRDLLKAPKYRLTTQGLGFFG